MSTPKPKSEPAESRIARLVRAYEDQLRTSLSLDPQTLEQIERQAERIGEQVKRDIQNEVADAQGTGDAGVGVACDCGQPARRKSVVSRQLVTLHGVLHLRRAYYYCPACQRGFCPLDAQLDIGRGQCSPAVMGLLARFCAYLPFRTAAAELESVCGLALAPRTLARLSQQVGKQLQRQAQQAQTAWQAAPDKEATPRPRQLHLTCDGVMVHVGGQWREAKLGCAYERAETGGLHTARYTATLAPSSAFGLRLRTLAHQCGADNCRKVAVVADGAEWVWQEAGKYFACRTQIRDYYHASQHLWLLAHARFGERSPDASAWMATQHERLQTDQIGTVLDDIAAWKPATESGRETRRKVHAYLHTHQKRMAYQTFAEAGFHIGSGVAEAGCKNVVQARLKRAGMRWSEPGAEAMLHLRAAWCSQQNADLRQAARAAVLPA